MTQLSFRELGASARVCDALAARSIREPFTIQSFVLPDALAGLDVLAKSPTGSGKTLAFAILIVERTTSRDKRPSALVLVPTRELAVQVTEELRPPRPRTPKVAAVSVCRPLSSGSRAFRQHPRGDNSGRLQDLADRRMLDLSPYASSSSTRPIACSIWVSSRRSIDHAPPCRETGRRCSSRPRSTARWRALARAYTSSPSRFEADLPGDRAVGEIDHHFVAVSLDTKVDTLVEHIRAADGLTLVFVRTKRGGRPARQEAWVFHQVDAVARIGDLLRDSSASARCAVSIAAVGSRGDRRRRSRPRHRRHRPRDQLRPARGGQGLRPSHRAHRSRGTERDGGHVRPPDQEDETTAQRTGSGTASSSSGPA